jgi:carbon monoxide dehydrogenase subunit G
MTGRTRLSHTTRDAGWRHVAAAALGVALLTAAASAAVAPDDGDIAATVHREGREVVIDVDMRVDATPEEAWEVLTDYDHMSRFVPDLVSSRIIRRDGDRIEVAQQARFHFGPFSLEAENVRAIDLVPPREIRSRLISGDMLSSTFVTRIAPDGNATRVTNHGEFIPNRWLPPFVGPAIVQAQTRKQFAELRAEILRRKHAA